jgi:hypothetical protein
MRNQNSIRLPRVYLAFLPDPKRVERQSDFSVLQSRSQQKNAYTEHSERPSLSNHLGPWFVAFQMVNGGKLARIGHIQVTELSENSEIMMWEV